jgi:hypothetical protein
LTETKCLCVLCITFAVAMISAHTACIRTRACKSTVVTQEPLFTYAGCHSPLNDAFAARRADIKCRATSGAHEFAGGS